MKMPRKRFVFYDTWAYVALADRADESAHEAAKETNRELLLQMYKPVTTNYILDETLTLIKRRLGYDSASRLLNDLEMGIQAELIQLVWITPEREREARNVFLRYKDKPRLSFTDCTNIVVMKELRLSSIFTADRDFETLDPKTYPFRCLIRESKGKYSRRPFVL